MPAGQSWKRRQLQTAAGRALKAVGAMYSFRKGFSYGRWRGDGEAMAWEVLSHIAGDAHVPPYAVSHNVMKFVIQPWRQPFLHRCTLLRLPRPIRPSM